MDPLGCRVGEASHPGPDDYVVLGTTNTGGLRQKEQLAIEQGSGIWTYAETQLSSVTIPSSAAALRYHAKSHNRHVRSHFSAPAPLRNRSSWAGSWTGVACVTDHFSKQLQLPWPPTMWESGRVLATQHFIGSHALTVVSIYGMPRGPTFPHAATLMGELLEFLSHSFVYGSSGLIAIVGDFNFSPHELPHFQLWQSAGWISAQDLACQRWAHEWQPTCKGATERDLIWLSPLLASVCRSFHVEDVFTDHSSVCVHLDLTEAVPSFFTWPRPREIPWDKVDLKSWHQHCTTLDFELSSDSTEAFRQIATSMETSLTGFVADLPQDTLTQAHCGRAQRLGPASFTTNPRTCKASRHGELQLCSDLVGQSVILWFKQMRRIQSLRHAFRAGRMHASATTYRLELWSSIVRAKGFQGGFRDWWSNQEFSDVIGHLPLGPPGLDFVENMYQAFHHAFRQFEAWHLRQKNAVIKEKYVKNFQAIFRDLRQPQPDQLTGLWTSKEYMVAAVRPTEDGQMMILLDKTAPSTLPALWYFAAKPVHVSNQMDELLVIDSASAIEPGSFITRVWHTSSISAVHEELANLWQPRWNALEAIDDDTWRRIIGFVRDFMPRHDFHLPPITTTQWIKSIRRFRPKAARGADGFAKLDLLNMPPLHVGKLLELLTAIESGSMTWPRQFLEGLVIALAKTPHAHTAGEYRPIVLLSIVYRCWASLRSRQLLRQLEAVIHDDAHGFLPTRETGQSWLQIQSAVELALQSRAGLTGLATDLVKAFNNIRRQPLFHLAKHVGVPESLLAPWQDFVGSFTRRFQILNQLSPPYGSNVGFAEGCPLSVAAMVILDWGLQIYQHHMAPLARTITFVDNISILGKDVLTVAWAFFSLLAYLNLWGLEIDSQKSYCWGTTPALRSGILMLGLQLVQDVNELGGTMTFCASRRVRNILDKGSRLEQKWQRLRKSRGPLHQKLVCLPMCFWSTALHGSLGCNFAETHLHHLRKKAMSALGVQCAGASAILRLSLSVPATADPGFYHVRGTIMDFRRLCFKTPDLIVCWKVFMERFEGHLRPGPFSKIISVLSLIGWSVLEPPFLRDHDAVVFNLLWIPMVLLEQLLFDAWLQHVSRMVRHRKTMQDLHGIDPALTLLDHEEQSPLIRARVASLQEGAFMSSWQHAKFDNTKEPICQLCMQPDTQAHWLRCPRFAHIRTSTADMMAWVDSTPLCVTQHLLMPRSPFALDVKDYFQHLPDDSDCFWSSPMPGTNHLFSDGSHFRNECPGLQTSAWALVNATSGAMVGFGPVPGLLQTIGRAELWGIIACLKWTLAHHCDTVLWCDSGTSVSGVQAMMEGEWTHLQPTTDNHDLWQSVRVLLDQLEQGSFSIRWTASHIDVTLCANDLEEWLAIWNDVADQHAVMANSSRSRSFLLLREKASQHFKLWRSRLHSLRDFYNGVANMPKSDDIMVDLTLEDETEELAAQFSNTSLSDALPINWQHLLQMDDQVSRLHFPFLLNLFEAVFSLEGDTAHFTTVSFVEITLWLVQDVGCRFPFRHATTRVWEFKTIHELFLRPTLASLTHLVRQAFTVCLKCLGLEFFLKQHFQKRDAGIRMPVDGLVLRCTHAQCSRFVDLVQQFTSHRSIRKAADIARPI